MYQIFIVDEQQLLVNLKQIQNLPLEYLPLLSHFSLIYLLLLCSKRNKYYIVLACKKCSSYNYQKVITRPAMIQHIKILVTKSDNLGLIMTKGENQFLSSCSLTSTGAPRQTHTCIHVHTCTHTKNKINI